MSTAAAEIVKGVFLQDPTLFRQQCYVDGRWLDAKSGRTTDVVNPADGHVIGTIPAFSAAETRAAIEAANRAFPAWRAKNSVTVVFPRPSPYVLFQWQLAPLDDIAHLITMPHVTREMIDQVITDCLEWPTTNQ